MQAPCLFLGLPDRVMSLSLTFTKKVNTHHMVAHSLSPINLTCKQRSLCEMRGRKKEESGWRDCQLSSWGSFLPNDISGYTSLILCPPALRMDCDFLNHSEPDQWICTVRLLVNLNRRAIWNQISLIRCEMLRKSGWYPIRSWKIFIRRWEISLTEE